MRTSNDRRLGLDLGGTKIEAVMVQVTTPATFRELARKRIPTQQHQGYATILQRTRDLIIEVARLAHVPLDEVSVGVGMPGGTRQGDGTVKNSNTTCLNGRPFREDLTRALGRPICFDNDANCFALAETHFGAARSFQSGLVFGVILGTGVGGGIVVDGHVWKGPQGIAGEWGHHSVYASPPQAPNDDLRPCYCGKRGCVEVYASGPAVEQDYARRAGAVRSMTDIVNLRSTDPHAREAFETFLDAFARGLANVIDILDPSAIVLGGGLSKIDALYEEGRRRVAELVFNDELTTPILRPSLGDSAGVIGAALLE
jgi:fructokinase